MTAAPQANRFRRLVHQLRTEGDGRSGLALAVGVFIGCLPVYGLHLALAWLAGRLLRLNRVKIYLAANISNPLVAPILLLAEVQAGAWLRRGTFHELTLAAVRDLEVTTVLGDLVLGSLVVGAGLAVGVGLLASLAAREDPDPVFGEIWRRASDRYLATGIARWEFARGKLRGDPIYRALVCSGLLPSADLLVDVGCGAGLALAGLVESQLAVAEGRWTQAARPPAYAALLGIELRPRLAAIAQRALQDGATIVTGDALDRLPLSAPVVLLIDVLHLMSPAAQDAVIRRAAAGLGSDGLLVVREADAAAGWRFQAVRAGNWLTAVATGRFRPRFHFRTADAWRSRLAQEGLEVDLRSMGEGTPFGNVLLAARPARSGAAYSSPLKSSPCASQ